MTAGETAFRRNGGGRRRSACFLCEITERTELKKQNRFMTKATWAIQYQAVRHGMRAAEFRRLYGWDAAIISSDMGHVYKNLGRCPMCRTEWSRMYNGISDLTLKIVDRNKPPFYDSNVAICCASCARKKAK
jgi:hypothetical protein